MSVVMVSALPVSMSPGAIVMIFMDILIYQLAIDVIMGRIGQTGGAGGCCHDP